jgi:hypothetical protein
MNTRQPFTAEILYERKSTMQEDAITDAENSYLDAEDWQIALEPYEGEPQAALALGINLIELKRRITALNMHDALDAIDVAIDCLYNHSDFHTVGRGLFETAVKGKLTTDKESLLRQLGVEIEGDDDG